MQGVSGQELNKILLIKLRGRFGEKPQIRMAQVNNRFYLSIDARLSPTDKAWVIDTCRQLEIGEIWLSTPKLWGGRWDRRVTDYFDDPSADI